MALKVFNSAGTSYDSAIIAAFNYIYKAQTLGANIAAINCSWGGGGSSSTSMKTLINQIGQNGSLFLFAAGNDLARLVVGGINGDAGLDPGRQPLCGNRWRLHPDR